MIGTTAAWFFFALGVTTANVDDVAVPLPTAETDNDAAPSPAAGSSSGQGAQGGGDDSSDPGDVEVRPAPPTTPLDRGLAALDELDVVSAEQELTQALTAGPYAYEDVVRLYAGLGIARAYLEDEPGAIEAFRFLLQIDPAHSLAYTTSPKATFLYERVRNELAAQRRIGLTLAPPAVVPFGSPIELTITRPADPSGLLSEVVVFWRAKGAESWKERVIAAPRVGQPVAVKLPAMSEEDAFTDAEGQLGALVEVALSARDSRGWEVFRGPALDAPVEIPVGFNAPGPWYTQWWVIGLGVGGAGLLLAAVATTVTGGLITARLWPVPDTVTASTTVNAGGAAQAHAQTSHGRQP